MKKKFVVLFVIIVITVSEIYAFGIGAQFNFSASGVFAPGVALVVSPSRSSHLAANWVFSDNNPGNIGLTYDLVPVNLPVMRFAGGSLNFTLGAGLFANAVLGDSGSLGSGLRIPVGFSLFTMNNFLEIFAHIAPSFGVEFIPSMKLSRPFYPVALGIRLWFN